MTTIESLSNDFAAIVDAARERVVSVGAGKARPRSGLLIGNGELVTVARVAEAGEKVPVHIGDREVSATVAGFDPASGIALLNLEGIEGPGPIDTSDEDIPAVGSLTVTVACPLPDGHEARLGMIRCVGGETRTPGGRKIGSYIQTDSARFRGFAGSIVFAASGRPIAMTMPVQRREEGFAIPLKEMLEIVAQLRDGGSIGTGYLGVQATPVDLPEERDGHSAGLLITGVEPDSPAEKAGLQVGSFIVSVAGTATPDIESLYDALTGLRESEELAVGVMKGGGDIEQVTVSVTLRRR